MKYGIPTPVKTTTPVKKGTQYSTQPVEAKKLRTDREWGGELKKKRKSVNALEMSKRKYTKLANMVRSGRRIRVA